MFTGYKLHNSHINLNFISFWQSPLNCEAAALSFIPLSHFLFPQRGLSKASSFENASNVLNSTTNNAA